MQALRNIVYIKADKDQNSALEYGTLKLILDTRYQPEIHAVQNGIIVQMPINIDPYQDMWGNMQTPRLDVELSAGDKVYFHHFIVAPDNLEKIISEDAYRCIYNNIYCKVVNGKIEMVERWMFVTQVVEDESETYKKIGEVKLFVKSEAEKLGLHGTVDYINPSLEKEGVRPGDYIIFTPASEYEIKVEGRVYYRMTIDDVSCVVKDGKMVPLSGALIVKKPIVKDQVRGGILMAGHLIDNATPTTCCKVELSGSELFPVGTEVHFEKKMAYPFTFEGCDYLMVRAKSIFATSE